MCAPYHSSIRSKYAMLIRPVIVYLPSFPGYNADNNKKMAEFVFLSSAR